ncbi:Bug family tripartite tricarboxylate transporter substrate binding protein [Noviherbaspirillum saxi]|uniref:Tripartite tricarboxylate transporter substrate binding protein n=1 Tax=Noviherbaspirillum saxi TaxID=2320863 RepID=A0A3A3FLY0_9BURK|nr:tripartite tricarboxylate transporter substrate binding protein [Noviherbaspirillum saxi]RJF95485.1 tripartite tricarboxylate transporter substrate binding protein [Noviherbaspirillum saxi]
MSLKNTASPRNSGRRTRLKHALAIFAGTVAATLANGVMAQTPTQAWPKNNIKLVVAATAGSAPDIIARVIADRLGPVWQQPIIVENRTGAGGLVAMRYTSSSAPDGYTLVLAHAAAAVITPLTYRAAKYDIEKDFTTIATVGYTPMGLIGSVDSSAKTLADVLEHSRKNPGKIVLGNPTQASIPHLTSELLNQQGKGDFFNVTFGGAANGIKSVINGDAQYYIDGIGPLMPMIRAKRVRPIAVFSDKVLEGLEGIPLAKDVIPGLSVTGWFVLAAPANMPKDIVARINADVNRVLAMPDVVARFREFGTYPQIGSVADAHAFIKKEKVLWSDVLKKANIKPE